MICTNCNAIVPDFYDFCNLCGFKLNVITKNKDNEANDEMNKTADSTNYNSDNTTNSVNISSKDPKDPETRQSVDQKIKSFGSKILQKANIFDNKSNSNDDSEQKNDQENELLNETEKNIINLLRKYRKCNSVFLASNLAISLREIEQIMISLHEKDDRLGLEDNFEYLTLFY